MSNRVIDEDISSKYSIYIQQRNKDTQILKVNMGTSIYILEVEINTWTDDFFIGSEQQVHKFKPPILGTPFLSFFATRRRRRHRRYSATAHEEISWTQVYELLLPIQTCICISRINFPYIYKTKLKYKLFS